jgi:hypothetical protein
MIFEVASYRALTDDWIHRRPVSWLFDQYERVQRAKWGEWVEGVSAIEVGVIRGGSALMSDPKKPVRLPPLPRWDEIQGRKASAERQLTGRPAWFDRYERANRLRGETEGANE